MLEQFRKVLSLEQKPNEVESRTSKQDVSMSVTYQGVPGSYSFEAASSCFGNKVRLLPYPEFANVCEAVATEQATYGVLPVFNSQTGRMDETERLIMSYALRTVGNIPYLIRHCLLCLPGQQLRDIVIVISHPQALAQCSLFLARFPFQQTPISNTAVGAQMIQEKQLRGFAAIASMSAAKLYGLTILAENIQNTRDNVTRFSIVAK